MLINKIKIALFDDLNISKAFSDIKKEGKVFDKLEDIIRETLRRMS